jgi:hypothetical protein
MFGLERYFKEGKAKMLHQDRFGKLMQKELQGDEPITVVLVRNSTPEPDGTYKDYVLRVPPTMKTAQEAVAWTFGIEDPKEYNPEVET